MYDEHFQSSVLSDDDEASYSEPIRIWILSGLCGSGKTQAAIAEIGKLARKMNVLYVCPTLDLITEVKGRLEDSGIKPEVINSAVHKNVIKRLIERLKQAPESGHVIMITWAAYEMLGFFPNRDNWRVIVDEVPQLDCAFPVHLSKHPEFVIDYLKVEMCDAHPGLYRVIPRSSSTLKRYLENNKDDVTNLFWKLYRHVLSKHHHVYVLKDHWDSFVSDHDDKRHRLTFVSILQPSLLRDCVVLGANIHLSLLFSFFSTAFDKTVVLEPCRAMSKRLLFEHHSFDDRVDLLHFPIKHFSKSRRNRGDTQRIMDEEALKALNPEGITDSQSFIYATNNDRKAPLLDENGGLRIPVKCHGQNLWSTYTNVYVSAALNRPPVHLKTLKALGLTDRQLCNDKIDTYYQIVMRSNLRVPGSDATVRIVVADAHLAKEIAAILGVSKRVRVIGGQLEATFSKKDKQQRYRLNKAYQALLQECRPNLLTVKESGLHFALTLPTSLYSTKKEEFKTVLMDLDTFLQCMKKWSKVPFSDKHHNRLFNSSVYRTACEENFRRQNAIEETHFLILDFDGGDFSPGDFVDAFGKRAPKYQRLPFVIYNSFSRTYANPNKFRVLVFFQYPARSADSYRACKEYVVAQIEQQGWEKEQLALDPQSGNPNQMFYAPCKNANVPDKMQFFEMHNCTAEQISELGLRPDLVLEAANSCTPPRHPSWNGQWEYGSLPDALTAPILAGFRDDPGQRNSALFSIGLQLARLRAGNKKLDEGAMERLLIELAGNDRSLRAKIPNVIRSLKNYRWLP